jgi:hypothetical protein
VYEEVDFVVSFEEEEGAVYDDVEEVEAEKTE